MTAPSDPNHDTPPAPPGDTSGGGEPDRTETQTQGHIDTDRASEPPDPGSETEQSDLEQPDEGEGVGLESLRSEAARLTDALARTQAEFANYRKRIARDSATATERIKASVAEALVPVLDAFDAAATHDSTSTAPLRGVLWDAAQRVGLDAIVPEPGARFDPTQHQAISGHADINGNSEVVVANVTRAGYRVGEHLLRPADVVVGEPADEQDPAEGSSVGEQR